MSPPVLQAQAGEVLADGGGYRWVAYQCDGATVAAVYVGGRLLRRDRSGWWVADARGKRQDVKGDPVARLAGTAPDGWPLFPEHLELEGVAR